jgi:hypothetical protein
MLDIVAERQTLIYNLSRIILQLLNQVDEIGGKFSKQGSDKEHVNILVG